LLVNPFSSMVEREVSSPPTRTVRSCTAVRATFEAANAGVVRATRPHLEVDREAPKRCEAMEGVRA
jgi:hypothetical protein